MLRITVNKSAAAAKSYYSEGLSKQDYYSQKDEIIGKWYGKAADKLGLSGDISKDDFSALCDNKKPNSDENLTPRTNEERRVGYDFTFSAKKSVTLLYALGDEKQKAEILNSFRSSVHETMSEIETGMQTRVRSSGVKDENRETGNIVYAEFIHNTSRPINGVPDPHLHAHCFAFNTTFDETEGKFKAGQFGQIKQDAPYYEAYFDSTFAEKLQGLGYEIERTKNGFELAGIDRNMIDKFSRRTEAIEKLAAEKGLTSDKEKDGLGALSRESKRKGLSPEEQKKEWLSRLSEGEKDGLNNLQKKSFAVEKKKEFKLEEAEKALDYSVNHHLERKSVSSDKEILATALKSSIGSANVKTVKTSFENAKQKGNILTHKEKGRTFLTSKNALLEEQKLIKSAFDFKGKFKPVNPQYEPQNDLLTQEQKQAVKNILSTSDGISIIAGKAGTGKTTLMKEVQEGVKKANKEIFAFAPTAEAADVQRKEGFDSANTVAALLVNPALQNQTKGGVIWIDEAGMISNKDMNSILDIAKNKNARLILTGDTRQHSSVQRGDALRIIQQKAGYKTTPVTKIQRQKNEDYKQAVKHISEGEIVKGFSKLDKIGAIHQMEDEGQRINEVATDYLKSSHPIRVAGKTRQREVLIVSPTHAEGDKVTEKIREKLKAVKVISQNEKSFTTLKNLQLTEAEKGKIENYQSGQFLVFHQNIKGVKRGAKLEITGKNDKNEILIKGTDNENLAVSLDHSKNFNLFQTHEIKFAEGDKIRITGNGKTLEGKHIFNGNLYGVKGFDKSGNIKLSNGATLSKDFGNFTHGYVVTSHASQGKTVDKVIISQSSLSSKAASQEQFYVSVSRGKEEIAIYTDDKEELLRGVSNSAARTSATELVEKMQKQAKEVNRLKAHERIKDGAKKIIDKVKSVFEKKPDSNIIQQNEQTPSKNSGRSK